MYYEYSFEKLEAWKEWRKLVRWIYDITDHFPKDERYGLVSQLRRASVSVVSNLAEGSARKSPKDQANFYQISYSSLMEILNQMIISNDLTFLKTEILKEGRGLIENLASKVATLRNSQLKKIE